MSASIKRVKRWVLTRYKEFETSSRLPIAHLLQLTACSNSPQRMDHGRPIRQVSLRPTKLDRYHP
jgi:hypothetical protein